MNQHQLHDFTKREILGITYFFVDKQQIEVVSKFLTSRYENARQFRGSGKNYQFIPIGNNILMSWISGVDFPVSNLITTKVIPQKFYACHYESNWYFRIANYVSIENNDVNVKFMHHKRSASKFSWTSRDNAPAAGFLLNVLRVKRIFFV